MPNRYSDQEGLYWASIAAEGATTAPGAAAGTSFIDASLVGAGANSFVSMLAILYPGDPRKVDSKDIIAFTPGTGEVTLAGAYKGIVAPIPAGVPYRIVTFRFVPAEVAALEAKIEDLKAKQMMIDTSQVFYVNGVTGSDLNDGLTWATAFVTIDYAVSQCVDDRGDVVFVAKHTYNENAHGTLGVRCNKMGVRIIGVGEGVWVGNSDNSGPGSAFTITASGVVLENMEVDKVDGTANANHVIDINGDGVVGVRLVDIRIEVPNAASTGLRITGGPGLGPIRAIFCNGYRKRASISCTTGLLGTGIDFDVCRECKVGGSIYSLDIGCNFGAGGDSNLLTRDTEISNCNTGIQLAAGATSNVLDASITNCPTEYSDASGNHSNNRHSSLTFIRNDVAHTPKYTGHIIYVDGTTGLDTNSGQSPEEARATITGALAVAVAGDRIIVKAGTYDEALVMNLVGLELVCEQGTVLVNSAGGGGTPLVVGPANYQRVVGAILAEAGQTGLQVTGSFCSIEDCLAFGSSIGFDNDGLETHMTDCRSLAHTTTGFDISNGYGLYDKCVAAGTGAAGERGFYLSVDTADNNGFHSCHTLNNALHGWEVIADADSNLFAHCSMSDGDGVKLDNGTDNTWTDWAEGSQIVAGQTRDQDLKDIYGRIGGASTEATYSLPDDTVENSAFTITPTGAQRITLILDLSNLVQNADIRVKYDMHGDGAPFPTMETFNWTTGMDDIVYFREISGQRAVEVTIQSLVAQGAVKDIDYEYVLG